MPTSFIHHHTPRGAGGPGDACCSGDPAPAELGGLPAGDGLVLADDLDLPQMQARVVHGLLGPRHPVTGRRLRDLVLGSGLLDENQVRRAGVPGHIRMNTHTLYDAAPFPAVPAAAMACGTRRAAGRDAARTWVATPSGAPGRRGGGPAPASARRRRPPRGPPPRPVPPPPPPP